MSARNQDWVSGVTRTTGFSTSHKVGLNGVTTVTKTIRNVTGGRTSSGTKDKIKTAGNTKESPTESLTTEEAWNMHNGVLTSDEFGDVNLSHKTVTLSKLSSVSDANIEGKIGAGSLLKYFEETGAVVCTRYCNYTAADQALKNGSTFDQVHCGMVYLDFMELLLPAYAGQLLTCVADIYYTAPHALEVKCVIWAEDLTACNRRLVCKASAWYVAFNVKNDWKLSRIPKLSIDPRLEKEGQARFEQYKEDRKKFNSSKIQCSKPGYGSASGIDAVIAGSIPRNVVQYSEMVLTHIADIYDCGTHVYMRCGAIVDKMEECACMVASRHSSAKEVAAACGYKFNFLELVPRGSLMIFFARLTFTSRRLMEIEVTVDIEMLHDQMLETKRVAVGFICFLALGPDNRVQPVPTMKVRGAEEERYFIEGQKRFDSMRKHLKHTDAHITIDVDNACDSRKTTSPSKGRSG